MQTSPRLVQAKLFIHAGDACQDVPRGYFLFRCLKLDFDQEADVEADSAMKYLGKKNRSIGKYRYEGKYTGRASSAPK